MISRWGCLEPNATLPRWDPFTLPWYGHISLANGTMFRVLLAEVSGANTPDLLHVGRGLFVGIEYVGCFRFAWPVDRKDRIFPSYVEEKLGVPAGDAEPLADLINAIMGIPAPGEFGAYPDIRKGLPREIKETYNP